MKKLFTLALLILVSFSITAQNNSDVKITKPLINFDTPNGGYYSDIIFDIPDSLYLGVVVKNTSDSIVHGVFARTYINTYGLHDSLSSDIINMAPHQTDTLYFSTIDFASSFYYLYSFKISFNVYMDSSNTHLSDTFNIIPITRIYGDMWGRIAHSSEETMVFNDSLIPGFSTGDFIGIQFRFKEKTSGYFFHFIASFICKKLPTNNFSGHASIMVYRNHNLILSAPMLNDTIGFSESSTDLISNGIMFNDLYADSLYYVGIQLDSGSINNLGLWIDTNAYHNFDTEAIAIVNDSIRHIPFVPLFGVLCDPEGIEEISNEKSFDIFPNPVSDKVHIDIVSGETLRIFDVNGKQILKKSINKHDLVIDLSHYPSGVYLFSIEDNGKIYTEKVIKE